MARNACTILLILSCLSTIGCAGFGDKSPKSYTTIVTDSTHDPEKARFECERAARYFEKGHLEKAEIALQDALIADVSYAPAHNNLGRIYFDQGNLYLAAWEFEYARRLLPESAEVVNNLGMVYEAAGQTDQAIEFYSTAMNMDEGNPEYTGNLARLLAREGQDPTQTAVLLQDLLLRDSRTEWIDWAHDQLNLQIPIRPAAHSHRVTEVGEPEVIPNSATQGHIYDLELPQPSAFEGSIVPVPDSR